MALASTLYNAIFKRTSTFTLAIVVGAVFFERGVDYGCNKLYRTINQGKLWEDVKDQFQRG